jgi:hypothetical protein
MRPPEAAGMQVILLSAHPIPVAPQGLYFLYNETKRKRVKWHRGNMNLDSLFNQDTWECTAIFYFRSRLFFTVCIAELFVQISQNPLHGEEILP